MSSIEEREELEGIAIIGMVCRFPGATTINEFWANLKGGKESISFFSEAELLAAGLKQSAAVAPNYVRARAVIDDIDLFDASFFGFSPREAEATDPQQRIFLECAHEALESAGYNPATYSGAIGVYAGVSTSNYFYQFYSQSNLPELIGGFQGEIGNDKDFLTTRVSYKLNLKGPSINVNTACSTSLVAVALACQSLLNYQSDMALAGGISINVPQKLGYFYQEGAINSPDGHCRPFDAKAEGTVGGNGVGIVVLKRLAEALQDGDYIYAVIKGSAVNNDGSGKVGYTAPSINGQAEVIAMAQAMANVEAESISYVEAHGTATPLGDPIEIAALTKVFGARTERRQFCAVGSVKSNIGHLDAAAGVAGLIKTALALQHQVIPASLHYEQANPKIDFGQSPFFVNARTRAWETNGQPRRAGVSSFGIGGTNAHLVLEEAPAAETSGLSRRSQLLVLSAKSAGALEQASEKLAQYLEQHAEVNLADVAYSYAVGRRAFEHRRVVVCADVREAIASLRTVASAAGAERVRGAGRVWSAAPEPKYRPVHFLFSGQGSQDVNMGRQLYESQRVYRETVDRCATVVAAVTGLDLRRVLYPAAGEEAAARAQLKQTGVTQPALFITEYALVQQWAHWGVKPQGMLGHSVGEYVAACVAGVLSEEDALRLVAVRGALMQELPAGGAMLAVGLGESEARAVAGARVSVAALNGAELTVLSGAWEALAAVEQELSEQGVWSRRLETSHAFHSRLMEPMLEEYRAVLAGVELREPTQAYVSSVTGAWVEAAQVRAVDYWVAQVREPVRFWAGLQELQRGGESVVVEVGPGEGLSVLARAVWGAGAVVAPTLGVERAAEQQSEEQRVSAAVGQVWLGGVEIDWSNYYSEEQRVRLPLPTYPFQRQRYWAEPKKNGRNSSKDITPSGKNSDLTDSFYIHAWKQSLRPVSIKQRAIAGKKLRWLLFDDEYLGPEIVKQLRQRGHEVAIVRTGEQFSKSGPYQFTINPKSPADYAALFNDLRQHDRTPDRIVHLWSVTPRREAQHKTDSFDDAQTTGFYSLLFLGQALTEQGIVTPLQLRLVSNSVHEVLGHENLRPEKATALCIKTIKQDHPLLKCQSIDLSEADLDGLPEAHVVSQLIAELLADSPAEVIAYRSHQRWVQGLERVAIETEHHQQAGLKNGGVYLITCEPGGAGIKLASYLARTVQAKLVLAMPPSIPKFEDWDEWLASHPNETGISHLLHETRTLQKSGANILLVHAAPGRLKEMREVLDQTLKHFGALHGVIHTVNLRKETSSESGQAVSLAEFPRLLKAKSQELLVLEEVLREHRPDFCLLLNSLAQEVGGSESVFDSAAAHFLNAFTRKLQRTTVTPWITLNWELRDESEPQEARTDNDITGRPGFAITPEEGMEAFSRVVRLGQPLHVFVSPTDPRAFISEKTVTTAAFVSEPAQTKETAPTSHDRQNLREEYRAPRNKKERIIADVWKELLGVKQLGVHDNFFEMGGHSLLAIQVMRRLSEILKIKLPPNRLIKIPTVAGLAKSLLKPQTNGKERPSPAVALQTGGSKQPFFCVHPIGGGVFCFRDLVRHLGPDQPFYGLQARELSDISDDGDPFSTLEDMAEYYVQAIRERQPDGPYLLGGFSWGSIVAFEMAQQLTRANQKVALLVIMDTPAPDIVGRIADLDDTTLLLIIARDLGHQRGMELPVTFDSLQHLQPDEKFNYVLRELSKAKILTDDVSQTWLQHHIQGYRARMSAVQNYSASLYPGPITLFRAGEADAEVEEHFDDAMRRELRDPTFGWGKLSTLPVEIHNIPGNHSVIVLEPNVQILAERLTECINRNTEGVMNQ